MNFIVTTPFRFLDSKYREISQNVFLIEVSKYQEIAKTSLDLAAMELERKHLLLLFALGVASKGFVKVRLPMSPFSHLSGLSLRQAVPRVTRNSQSALGTNASLVLLLSVALYYWRACRRGDTVYDDIARQQVEAAAKIDQLHGIGDGTVSEMDLHVRKTQFRLRPDDAGIIT